jgi:hypothetical protein
MEERNPYLNPHFRRQIQQPDAPEPGNRPRNATDILLQPNITHMRQQRQGHQSFFFSPFGSGMHQHEPSFLRVVYGPEVLNPPQPRSPQGGQLGTFWQEQDANRKKKKN